MKDIHLKLRPETNLPMGLAGCPSVRLRKVLKELLRRQGFRCVDFCEVEPEEPLKPRSKETHEP